MATPRTKFDWSIYADATFAGLSVLLPLPLIDLAFEWFFRRRMPQAIAKRNGRLLSYVIVRDLNRTPLSCSSCLLWPILLIVELLKRTYRTILYFLTVKAASDQLSFYWHRAFLMDYMLLSGHLDDEETAQMSIVAFNQVLADITTSPLTQLAQQIIEGVSHLFRTIIRWATRRQEDLIVQETRSLMARTWGRFSDYFEALALQYDKVYEELQHKVEEIVIDDDQESGVSEPKERS